MQIDLRFVLTSSQTNVVAFNRGNDNTEKQSHWQDSILYFLAYLRRSVHFECLTCKQDYESTKSYKHNHTTLLQLLAHQRFSLRISWVTQRERNDSAEWHNGRHWKLGARGLGPLGCCRRHLSIVTVSATSLPVTMLDGFAYWSNGIPMDENLLNDPSAVSFSVRSLHWFYIRT